MSLGYCLTSYRCHPIRVQIHSNVCMVRAGNGCMSRASSGWHTPGGSFQTSAGLAIHLLSVQCPADLIMMIVLLGSA